MLQIGIVHFTLLKPCSQLALNVDTRDVHVIIDYLPINPIWTAAKAIEMKCLAFVDNNLLLHFQFHGRDI